MKLTVKNLLPSRYGVNTTQGIMDLEPGEEAELDFAPNEAKALSMNSAFAVKGYSEAKEEANFSDAAKDADAELTRLRTENGTLASRTKDLETQLGGIVELFGTPDVDETNVRSAVEKLIQDNETLLNQQANAETTDAGSGSGSTDLAAAVQQLDDKNDDQWTQSGKPRLSALSAIMGSEVTAAQYDALPDDQKRNRA